MHGRTVEMAALTFEGMPMLSWFEQRAPIRVKFKALLAVYTMLTGTIAGAAVHAALHASGINANLVIGVAAAGFVAVVGVTLLASRLICTPYVTTVVRMEALAAGDLTSEVRYTNNRDCVGRMTKAMEIFRDNSLAAAECNSQRAMALSMGEGLGKLAAGDLTHRITADLTGPFEQLKEDFNLAIVELQQVMSAVSLASDNVHRGSTEIRSASDNLSQRTEQQAASLEQTAAALDELTGTVRRTATDAGRASDAVGAARTDAESGGEVVRRAVAAMSDIERSSSEISEIISVIDGIAFQTNLLALNAGVEAARAGEAGKGFAVVASEVRALAQRSADAAKDVKTRISRSSEQVGVGVQLVGETGHALQRIIGRIGEISDIVAAIAGAAAQQSAGLQEINTAVGEMDGVTQQNAAMVEESNAAARSLSDEASTLVQQVTRFSLGGGDVASGGRSGGTVHELQQRVAAAAPRLKTAPRPTRGRGGAQAAQVADEDWASF